MRRRAIGSAAIGLLAILLLAGARQAPRPLVVRVAPEGAAVSGEGRVASLSAALARVAEWRRRGSGVAAVVELEPGRHRLEGPVRIGPEHGGTAGLPLVIRGAPDGTSRLSGSLPLIPAPLPEDLREQLPPAARAQVRAYRLPEALRREPAFREPKMLNDPAPLVTEIFDAAGALRPARWPNEGYAAILPVGRSGIPGFAFKDPPPGRTWEREPELWAEGYWKWDWLVETIPVARAEPRGGAIELARPPYETVRAGGRGAVLHALSELDEAGEWWRDRRRGLLLAWPRPGGADLEASVAQTLLSIEGARHVRIENLSLDRVRRDLVVVKGGADVVIRWSDLGWSAGRAAVFDGVAGGGLEGCTVHDTGATAIRLSGGDRASLLPGGLFLRDGRVTRFARLSQTQNPAVQLDGVGAQVSGNYIHDAIGYAVHLRGNDHLFARNEVARLLKGVSDSGAIYAGRDWTARGTVIRENYVHGIEPAPGFEVKGVYLDDMASGFKVERNVFVNVQKPVFIGGGSDNDVSENVFVASSPAISLDSRGQTWMAEAVGNPHSEVRAAYAAVPVASERWRERYPPLAGLLSGEPGVARNNQIVDNVFLNSKPLFVEQEGDPRRQTIVLNTELSVPGLALPAGGALAALARLIAERKLPVRMTLEAMRRDTLPERPFRNAPR